MRILCYTLFLIYFTAEVLTAQTFQWAKHFAGSGSPLNRALNFPRSITTDASGNVYTTGCFGGTVDFDPAAGAYPLATVSLSNTNVFISKLTACGDFVWARSFAGLKDDQAFCIKTDNSGNVITSGHFSGITDFDPGAGVYNLTGSAIDPGFISKLDASGNFIWARKLDVITISVTPDALGNIYASGSFSGTVDFDPGAGVSNLVASGSTDLFVVKLDASGNFVWAKKMGSASGSVSGIRIAKKIFTDASSNLFTAISFSGTVDFDPGAGISNLTASSSSDFVIVKLDASGNFIWAKRFGGASTSSLIPNSVDVDAAGNSYFSGSFSGTVDFDPSAAIFNLTSVGSAGGLDIFFAKIDASGNFTWAKRTDVNATSFFLSIVSIASDASGNAYVTGNFNGTVDFDPSPATSTLSTTSGDLFISTFDAAGNFRGATNSSGLSMCIGTDNSGSAYVGSFFGGVTTDFDSGPGTYTLTINPANHADIALIKFNAITATIAGPTTLCSGSTATYSLNAMVAATGYTWTVPSGAVINSGQNTSVVNVTFGTSSGTLSVIPSYTCISNTSSTTLSITVNATPTISLAGISSNTICSGNTVTITPSGATTYTLMPGNLTGSTFTLSPASTTTYTINGTNGTGCSSASSTNLKITITVNTLPTPGIASVSSSTICSGNTSVITPNGASTYTLMPGNLAGTSFTVSPVSTTGYTISGTSASGCISTPTSAITTTITVTPTPTLGITSVSNSTICAGNTSVITPNGASTYTLTPGNLAGTSFSVSPLATTVYTINGKSATGCVNAAAAAATTTITVNPTPTLGITSVSNSTICAGNTSVITPNGASTYTLTPGNLAGTSFSVSPLATTVYTINGKSAAGCINTAASAVTTTITVNPTPTLGITSVSNSTICSGNASVITPNGASSYTLIPGNLAGTSFSVSPLATTVYTINGKSATGCINTTASAATTTITVNPTPTLGITSVSNSTICSGNASVITPNGASTYTLTPGNLAGTSFSVSPLATTVYTINGKSAAGCINTPPSAVTTTITVTPIPTIGLAFVSSNTVCPGNSSVIIPNGASSYTLIPGNIVGTSFTVTPIATTAYTISGTSASGCRSTNATIATTTVAVNANPSIGISSVSSASVCPGNSAVIIPNGGSTYTLTPGNIAGTSFTVTPLGTTVYTISGSSAAGCISSTATPVSTTITLNQTPTISIVSVSSNSICSGNAAVITPGGASTYTIMPGNITGTSFTVSPLATSVYTISGTNVSGCTSIAGSALQVTITVSPTQSITLVSVSNASICPGNSSIITLSGAGSYNLMPGNITGSSFTVSPAASTTYTITGTLASGCLSSPANVVTSTITVFSTPTISLAYNSTISCFGGDTPVTANASGGTSPYSYTWQNSAVTTNAVNYTAGTYTVSVADANTCASATQTVVLTQPAAAISVTEMDKTPACVSETNGTVGITVSGGTALYTVTWSNGATGNSITNAAAGALSAIITDAKGCSYYYNTTIESKNCIEPLVPQIFTPNGDGKNDQFVITILKEFPHNTFEVFNRWGSLVYSKKNYQNEWDGKSNVGDATGNGLLPSGTYFVILDFGDGKTNTYKGYVELKH